MGWIGAGLAAVMVVGARLFAGPRGAAAVALGLTGLLALRVGTGARWLSLELEGRLRRTLVEARTSGRTAPGRRR